RVAPPLSLRRRDEERTLPLSRHRSVTVHGPSEQLVIRMTEQVIALHVHHQRRSAYPRKGKELLRALSLIQCRVRRAIGEHQPVKAELSVIGCITKIATV